MVRYYCKYCDYDAGTRKSSYTKHLLTIKHQKALKTRFPPEDREELQSRIDEFDWYYTKNDDNLSDALSSSVMSEMDGIMDLVKDGMEKCSTVDDTEVVELREEVISLRKENTELRKKIFAVRDIARIT